MTLRRNPAPDPRADAALAAGGRIADLPPGTRGIFVGRAYYGCVATVLEPASVGFTKEASIRIQRCAPTYWMPCVGPCECPSPAAAGRSLLPPKPAWFDFVKRATW